MRECRLRLRQHVLLGVLRVLLRGERRQLLSREHRDGRLVDGGQLVVLRRPAVLHGLQFHLRLRERLRQRLLVLRAGLRPDRVRLRPAGLQLLPDRLLSSSATGSATRTSPAWGGSSAGSWPASPHGRWIPRAPPPSPSTTPRRSRTSRAGRRPRRPLRRLPASHPPRTARSSVRSGVPTAAATPCSPRSAGSSTSGTSRTTATPHRSVSPLRSSPGRPARPGATSWSRPTAASSPTAGPPSSAPWAGSG